MATIMVENPEKQRSIILKVLEQLRMRKARPDLYRISFLAHRDYDIPKEVTRRCLDDLVSSNVLIRVEFNGNHSYRYVNINKMSGKERLLLSSYIKESVTLLTVPNKQGVIIKKQGVSNKDIRKWIIKNKNLGKSLAKKYIAWQPILSLLIRKRVLTQIRNGKYVLFDEPSSLENTEITNLSNDSDFQQFSNSERVDDSHNNNSNENQPAIQHLPKISITTIPNKSSDNNRKRSWRLCDNESSSSQSSAEGEISSPHVTGDASSSSSESTSTSEGYSTSSGVSDKRVGPPTVKPRPQTAPLGPLVISISPHLAPSAAISSSSSAAAAGANPPRPSPLNNLPRCDFCLQTSAKSDCAVEQLLYCRDCQAKAHPSCMNYSEELAKTARLTKWQCIDCKVCCICSDDKDSVDEMLFCDSCDRGYHMHCHFPEINKKPNGSWECSDCYEKMFENKNRERVEKLLSTTDSSFKGEQADPKTWKILDVVDYFQRKGFSDLAKTLQDQDIDGSSLLLLKRKDVVGQSSLLSLRLGPALKVFQIIECLRKQSEHNQLYETVYNGYASNSLVLDSTITPTPTQSL